MVERHVLWGLVVVALASSCGDKPQDDTGSGSGDVCTLAADAGADQEVLFGAEVSLDASGSEGCDGGSGDASFHWSFDTVPGSSSLDVGAFSVNDSAQAQSTTFVPDAVGSWVLSLQVRHDDISSDLDVVVVEVEADGLAPVADCGGDLDVEVGQLATLYGNGSYDPEGADLAWAWSLGSVPDGSGLSSESIFDGDEELASIVPDVAGAYDIHLVVSDGQLESEPAYCVVTATEPDLPPVADAGEGGELPPCDDQIIQLEGYGSYDPEGMPLSYLWGLLDKPEGSEASAEPCETDEGCYEAFDDTSSAGPVFTWDLPGSYTMQLEVSDGAQWSAPDVVTYEVSDCP
jgi:hypothetical protein